MFRLKVISKTVISLFTTLTTLLLYILLLLVTVSSAIVFIKAQQTSSSVSIVGSSFSWTNVFEPDVDYEVKGTLTTSSVPRCSLKIENVEVLSIRITATLPSDCEIVMKNVTVAKGVKLVLASIGSGNFLFMQQVQAGPTSSTPDSLTIGDWLPLSINPASAGFSNITIVDSSFTRRAPATSPIIPSSSSTFDQSCAGQTTGYLFAVCISPPAVAKGCTTIPAALRRDGVTSAVIVNIRNTVIQNTGWADKNALQTGALVFGKLTSASTESSCLAIWIENSRISSLLGSSSSLTAKNSYGILLMEMSQKISLSETTR
jgi:hypothetical protein